jgi:4-hydroxy-4-methyl-2-oxoglutarate aldolase
MKAILLVMGRASTMSIPHRTRTQAERRLAAAPAALVADAAAAVAAAYGVLPSRVQAQTPGLRCGGPAHPVTLVAGDNLGLHHALAAARPGAVVVAAVEGVPRCGLWGEILSAAARRRGVAALVTDGHVRDRERLAEHGVAVFARGVDPRQAAKEAPGRPGAAVFDEIRVEPDDLVVGDADGVVVVARAEVADVAARAAELEARENEVLAGIAAGATTLELLGLPLPPSEPEEEGS